MSISEPPINIRLLKNASEAEIEQSITVLEDAFRGDPFTDVLTGGDLTLAHPQADAMFRGGLVGGQIYVISVGPNPTDIVGVTIWYPPGKSYMSTEEERAQGWNQFLEAIPEKLRIWFSEHYLPRMDGLSKDALGAEYTLNAWHLQLFGVLKAYHGKGYGRRLYEVVERQARAQGAPMYLETTTDLDVKIYQKLGFHVRSEVNITNWVGTSHITAHAPRDDGVRCQINSIVQALNAPRASIGAMLDAQELKRAIRGSLG